MYDLIWQDQITDLDHSLIVIWLIFSPKELIVIWLIFLMIEWSRSDHFFEKTTPCFFQSFMKSKICFYIELILYINFNFILIYEIFLVNWNWKLKWNCLVQPEWNWKSVSIECSTFKKKYFVILWMIWKLIWSRSLIWSGSFFCEMIWSGSGSFFSKTIWSDLRSWKKWSCNTLYNYMLMAT